MYDMSVCHLMYYMIFGAAILVFFSLEDYGTHSSFLVTNRACTKIQLLVNNGGKTLHHI
jgi:hypothetical protein